MEAGTSKTTQVLTRSSADNSHAMPNVVVQGNKDEVDEEEDDGVVLQTISLADGGNNNRNTDDEPTPTIVTAHVVDEDEEERKLLQRMQELEEQRRHGIIEAAEVVAIDKDEDNGDAKKRRKRKNCTLISIGVVLVLVIVTVVVVLAVGKKGKEQKPDDGLHGCLASAGYAWCPAGNACTRFNEACDETITGSQQLVCSHDLNANVSQLTKGCTIYHDKDEIAPNKDGVYDLSAGGNYTLPEGCSGIVTGCATTSLMG